VTTRSFCHSYRVRYADCTLGNHVYYARYFDILEVGRTELFRHIGQPFLWWQERGLIFPVIECRVRYKGAARYDELLTLELSVNEARGIRLNLGYRIQNHTGQSLVEAETRHVCTSLEDKPRRLPPELITALKPFLKHLKQQSFASSWPLV
jgi:acyl-CoA thioester hydrolase